MKLRVCHYPQIPCNPFIVEVVNEKEAYLLEQTALTYNNTQDMKINHLGAENQLQKTSAYSLYHIIQNVRRRVGDEAGN